jgi:hypothetical protein
MPKNKQKQRRNTRLEFTVRIGPELMELIEKQMERIKDVTYGVVKDSAWESGEILAKKLKGEV